MPLFSNTKRGFFGLSFLKPKNPKGRKSDVRLKSIKPFRRFAYNLYYVIVGWRCAVERACGCKVGGHGVERATSSERNGVGMGWFYNWENAIGNDFFSVNKRLIIYTLRRWYLILLIPFAFYGFVVFLMTVFSQAEFCLK